MLQSHPELNTRPAPAASRVGMCSVKARDSEILRGGGSTGGEGGPQAAISASRSPQRPEPAKRHRSRLQLPAGATCALMPGLRDRLPDPPTRAGDQPGAAPSPFPREEVAA